MPEGGWPEGGVRDLGGGETMPAAVLGDLLLSCLRHDALADAALERLHHMAGGGRVDPPAAGRMARDLLTGTLAGASGEDWDRVGAALRDAHLDAFGEGAGSAAVPGGGGEGA